MARINVGGISRKSGDRIFGMVQVSLCRPATGSYFCLYANEDLSEFYRNNFLNKEDRIEVSIYYDDEDLSKVFIGKADRASETYVARIDRRNTIHIPFIDGYDVMVVEEGKKQGEFKTVSQMDVEYTIGDNGEVTIYLPESFVFVPVADE